MPKTLVGLFRDPEEAQAAINDLEQTGFTRNEVSLVAPGDPTDVAAREREADTRTGTGAVVGGAAGMMIGLATFAIPGIGPILAAGPFAVALTGAGVGAAAGGMLGALSELGVSDNREVMYAEGIRRGGTLVVVHPADDEQSERAEAIFDRHDAMDIEEHAGNWRKTGWKGFDPSAAALLDDSGRIVVPDPADPDHYDYYRRVCADAGLNYEEYANAYRYGQTLASDPAHSGVEWDNAEPALRSRWERDHSDSWARVKDVMRHAWDHTRGKI
jgi:uncharacterized membrane protein